MSDRRRSPDGPLTPEEREAVIADYLAAAGGSGPSAFVRFKWPSLVRRAEMLGYRDDIDAACLSGLVKAARKFDPAYGVKFSTYAGPWMRQAVQRLLWVDHRDWLRRGGRKLVSGQAKLGHTDDAGTVFGLVAGDSPNPAAVVASRETAALVREALRRHVPSASYRYLMELRWGLGDEPPKTLEETGEVLSMSRERVRQLEARVMDRLRPVLGKLLAGRHGEEG